ncbi:MAG: DUF2490 domain-containing protein [Muribaculaceae bacterium]|nr:DUF2490 domain-containing protein [Muribaculaceae bacterium]
MKKILTLIVITAATAFGASAQQLWTSAEFKMPVTKKITAGVEAEYRTTDRLSSTERWTINASVAYRMKSYLKFDAGYRYINGYRDDEFSTKMRDITEHPKKPYRHYYTPGYQQQRHRAYISATGSVKAGKLSISLRERYQFSHRIGKDYTRYYINSSLPTHDFTKDDFMTSGTLQERIKEARNKHSLRSRIEAEYTFSKKCRFKPYASIEMYNTLNDKFRSDKTRYTAGCSYKINPHNSIDLFYRFVREYEGSTNINVIGVGYCFKL